MINISEKAKKILLQKISNNTCFLRILVKTGGCAGMTYDAEIDRTMADNEKVVFEVDGIRVVSTEESQQYLDGLEVDYSDDLITAGFRFSNSSNKSSCGCGASFTLADLPTFQPLGGSCGN